MGQYFKPINVTKKEYVDPWEIGGVAKLWEWCVNKWAGILPYLLRKSDGEGGGDVDITDSLQFAGRWAGDEVYLIGDYDNSKLWETADNEYTNISEGLVKEYNKFVNAKDYELRYEPRKDYSEITKPKGGD